MIIPFWEASYEAMKRGDLAEFQRLMKAHPDIVQTEKERIHWLHHAASHGRLNFVKFFVGLGVDVNATEDSPAFPHPEGPIQHAAAEGHLDVVRWLLDHGAKINHTVKGQTRCFALASAARNGHMEVVKLLIERGAEVNASWLGMTPLDHAQMYGQEEIVAYLRSVGAKEGWQLVPMQVPAGHRAILKHFQKHRGSKPGPLALRQVVPGDPAIAIHVVPPTKKWPGQTLFTVGMSDRPLNLGGGEQGFAELAIYLPKEWRLTRAALGDPSWAWPIHWLLKIGHYPHETGSWPEGGALVFANEEPPEPLAPNTALSCLLCLADPDDFGQIQLPDHRLVQIYSLYPIYTEERDLEKREGTQRLIELFEEHKVPRTVEINRANVATLAAPKKKGPRNKK